MSGTLATMQLEQREHLAQIQKRLLTVKSK